MERHFFGTDGIRGEAGIAPLNPETIVRIGKAIAAIFIKHSGKHRILIGKDTRLSGYMIETALASGITSMGVDVWLSGPVPTPGIAYLTRSMRADAGIVISASHNAFEDNGIKIFASDGFKLPDATEIEIERLVIEGELKGSPSASIGKAARIDDAIGRYTVFLKETFPRDLKLDGMRIGLDCANGAAYVVAPQVFSELGAEVISRGISPNGRNINAGFGSLFPDVVRKLVLEQRLDCGMAFDGDADRIIMVDEKGGVVDGDAILAILALDMKASGRLAKDTVVATTMSNMGLEVLLQKNDIALIRANVGDRYVNEAIQTSGAMLGGEQSGHMIMPRYQTTGDGVLTALQVVSVMKRTGKSLSQLSAQFERFPQKLINIAVTTKPPFKTVPRIQEAIESVEKKLEGRGRVLVRYSGTEPKARVMVESQNEIECNQLAEDISVIIKEELGGDEG